MTFHDQQLISMTFKAWKMKFLNFMTFQVFHDLYEPCKASEFDKKGTLFFVAFRFAHKLQIEKVIFMEFCSF